MLDELIRDAETRVRARAKDGMGLDRLVFFGLLVPFLGLVMLTIPMVVANALITMLLSAGVNVIQAYTLVNLLLVSFALGVVAYASIRS